METMKITKELKEHIEKNQNQLKAGIRNHQRLLAILESDPDNTNVQKQLQTEQEHIIVIGLEQKVILDKLRKEYKIFRKQTKINGTKNSIDDKRFNLTIALHRAKKQTIINRPNNVTSSSSLPLVTPPNYSSSARSHRQRHQPSPPSPSDDYDSSCNNTPLSSTIPANHNVYGALERGHGTNASSTQSSPEPQPPAASGGGELVGADEEEEGGGSVVGVGKRPLVPEDMGQVQFLQYLHLATHEVFKEMQTKRVERKRRSTANPQFLYARGWDISKRKRNFYLSNLTASPPTTRQSTQRNSNKVAAKLVVALQPAQQQQQDHHQRACGPPITTTTIPTFGPSSPSAEMSPSPKSAVGMAVTLPGITHLPSGLTIEPVREEQTICIDCKQSGNLSICEECSYGFHVTCHNRPLVTTPRHCPVCYTDAKEARARHERTKSPIINVPQIVAVVSEEDNQLLIEEKRQLKTALISRNKLLTSQLTDLQDQHSKLTISLRAQEQHREELITHQDTTKDKIHKILSFITKVKGGNTDERDGEEITQNGTDDITTTTEEGGLEMSLVRGGSKIQVEEERRESEGTVLPISLSSPCKINE